MRILGGLLALGAILWVGFVMPQPYGNEISVPGTGVFVLGLVLAFWPQRRPLLPPEDSRE